MSELTRDGIEGVIGGAMDYADTQGVKLPNAGFDPDNGFLDGNPAKGTIADKIDGEMDVTLSDAAEASPGEIRDGAETLRAAARDLLLDSSAVGNYGYRGVLGRGHYSDDRFEVARLALPHHYVLVPGVLVDKEKGGSTFFPAVVSAESVDTIRLHVFAIPYNHEPLDTNPNANNLALRGMKNGGLDAMLSAASQFETDLVGACPDDAAGEASSGSADELWTPGPAEADLWTPDDTYGADLWAAHNHAGDVEEDDDDHTHHDHGAHTTLIATPGLMSDGEHAAMIWQAGANSVVADELRRNEHRNHYLRKGISPEGVSSQDPGISTSVTSSTYEQIPGVADIAPQTTLIMTREALESGTMGILHHKDMVDDNGEPLKAQNEYGLLLPGALAFHGLKQAGQLDNVSALIQELGEGN